MATENVRTAGHSDKRKAKRLHAFGSIEQPPLCGQKDHTGRRFLPVRRTTTRHADVTCKSCLTLLPKEEMRRHLASIRSETGE